MKIEKNSVIAFVVTAVLLSALWIICPICFQNNDDKILMYLTAGFTTGSPEVGTIFGSFYYYWIIALLYRIYSGIAWYTVTELTMIAVSLWVICKSLMRFTGRILGLIIFTLLFLICFLHFSTALQYTATAGMVAGAAACSLISGLEDKRLLNKDFVISLIMLALAYGIRKQFGIVGLGAILCILFFEILGDEKAFTLKRTVIVIVVFAIAFSSNYVYEKITGISEFNEYYSWAGDWNDYPHLDYADDTEGVYESVGWDETLYNAASNWFFMDEHMTTENFKTIVSAYDGKDLCLRDYYDRAYNLLMSSMVVNIQVVIWLVVVILINVIAIFFKKYGRKILAMDCMFLMFVFVSVYFLIEGRFPMRAYQALVFIFMVPSFAMGIADMSDTGKQKCVFAVIASMILVTVAGNIVKPDTNIIKYTYTVTHDIYRTRDIEKGVMLEDYAINHPDDVYIYDLDLALPANAFQVYEKEAPKNLLFWGGWFYNTPMYRKQLATNGYDELFAEDFLNGKVYFCGLDISSVLQEYMESRYSGVSCEIVDELGEIKIYQFNR